MARTTRPPGARRAATTTRRGRSRVRIVQEPRTKRRPGSRMATNPNGGAEEGAKRIEGSAGKWVLPSGQEVLAKACGGVDVELGQRVLLIRGRGPLDIADSFIEIGVAQLKVVAGYVLQNEGQLEASGLLVVVPNLQTLQRVAGREGVPPKS